MTCLTIKVYVGEKDVFSWGLLLRSGVLLCNLDSVGVDKCVQNFKSFCIFVFSFYGFLCQKDLRFKQFHSSIPTGTLPHGIRVFMYQVRLFYLSNLWVPWA